MNYYHTNFIDYINECQKKLAQLDIVEQLRFWTAEYPNEVTFSSSLSYEDQVVTHLILSNHLDIDIFTLDTGRLFPEIYSVLSRTNEKYHTNIKTYFPDFQKVEKLLNEKGPFSFYHSIENRKECCFIRKIEPLKRALAGKKVWITGIRAEQSENRGDMQPIEWDNSNQMIKYHPIFDWSFDEVKDFIKKHNIPYNPLHSKGFISIGCAPCTRAVREGEDFRAGRWWWEDTSKKECGLHKS